MEDGSIFHTPFKIIGVISSLPPFKYGYYRIVVLPSTIKYLAFTTSIEMSLDSTGERLDIVTLPEGDWNIGYLIPKLGSDKLILDSVEKKAIEGVINTWCSDFIDYLSLNEPSSSRTIIQGQRQMHSILCHDHFGVQNVIVNFEWYPEDIYGPIRETEIYSLLEAHDIAPKFLAHVTENHDRVIGYMVEQVSARSATYDDLQICREVLSKLHKLGILHGSLDPTSFLISNGRALLHGFAAARIVQEMSLLEEEMDSISSIFQCR